MLLVLVMIVAAAIVSLLAELDDHGTPGGAVGGRPRTEAEGGG